MRPPDIVTDNYHYRGSIVIIIYGLNRFDYNNIYELNMLYVYLNLI